jgi:hypothetical protein
MKRFVTAGSVFCFIVLFIASAVLVGVYGSINYEYTYQNTVRAYRDQALSAQTFEAMLPNLVKMENGMHTLGLQPNMCAQTFSWECTPEKTMVLQYQIIDSFINRTIYYLNFYRGNVSGQTGTQFLSYGDQLHQFKDSFDINDSDYLGDGVCYDLTHECMDSTAHNAYILNFHFYYAWSGVFLVLAFVGGVLGFFGLYFLDEWRQQREWNKGAAEREAKERKDYPYRFRPDGQRKEGY